MFDMVGNGIETALADMLIGGPVAAGNVARTTGGDGGGLASALASAPAQAIGDGRGLGSALQAVSDASDMSWGRGVAEIDTFSQF